MRDFGQRGYGFWGSSAEGTISGQCTDRTGLLGPKGAKVPCGELRAAMEGLPPGSYPSYTPPADDSVGSKAADWLDDTFGITDPETAKIPMPDWLDDTFGITDPETAKIPMPDWVGNIFGTKDPETAKIPMVAYVLVLGLAGFGIYTHMKKQEA